MFNVKCEYCEFLIRDLKDFEGFSLTTSFLVLCPLYLIEVFEFSLDSSFSVSKFILLSQQIITNYLKNKK